MKRSAPMKRSPIRSAQWNRRELEVLAEAPSLVLNILKPLRAGTYAGTTTGVAMPKEPRLENPHLLLMARNQPRPCLLRVPGLCLADGRVTSCCACHGNAGEWNKAGAMKAHDFFSVWGCARCHSWLDASYSASGEERDQAFRRALALQIVHWDVIASYPTGKRKDVEAAHWALQHLVERGYAIHSPHTGRFAIPNLKKIHAR